MLLFGVSAEMPYVGVWPNGMILDSVTVSTSQYAWTVSRGNLTTGYSHIT